MDSISLKQNRTAGFDSELFIYSFFDAQSMLEVIRDRYPDLERTIDSANDTTKWHRVPGYRGR